MYVPPSTRPAIFCWMTGVAVLAVIWSAVVLPSGAAAAFALTEQDPPFLSHVATVKSSEYFAMFSNGAADRLERAALDGLEVRVLERPQVVGGGVREVRAAVRRRAGPRVLAVAAAVRGRARVDRRVPEVDVRCVRGVGERRLARQIGHEAGHVGLRVACARRARR